MVILLVEDNAGTRRALTYLLTRAGHAVRACGSVAAAGVALAARSRPDVALVDRRLPDGDGVELLPDLAAAGVPAVAFTGMASPADAERSVAVGFAVHLAKPTDLDGVLAAVGAAVGRAQTA